MISIIIPVYNEGACLDDLFAGIAKFVNDIDEDYEVIFIDDHSTDNTNNKLIHICSLCDHYRMKRLSRNSGSHLAIIAGLSYCKGDCAVFLSADLQDPLELIPEMLIEWKKGRHIVWAVRIKREDISLFERFSSKIFHFIFNRLSVVKQPSEGGSDFALLDRKVIDAVVQSAGANTSLNALIASTGFNAMYLPYTKRGRKRGHSKWTLSKKINNFIDAIVGYSYVPMRFMSISGFIVASVGFLYALFLIWRFISFGITGVSGWSSLMVVVLVLTGGNMVMMGVLGEYLWRTFQVARNEPLFFVEESVGFETDGLKENE